MSSLVLAKTQAQKGQVINLSKTIVGQDIFRLGVGWNPKSDTSVPDEYDVDLVAIICNEDGTGATEGDLFYYHSMDGKGTSSEDFFAGLAKQAIFEKAEELAKTCVVVITKDNRDGEGDGDDETIFINKSLIPAGKKVVVAMSIHEADTRGQVFGMVEGLHLTLYGSDGAAEINFDMDDFSIETGALVAEFYSKEGTDRFKALGKGFNGDLNALLNQFA